MKKIINEYLKDRFNDHEILIDTYKHGRGIEVKTFITITTISKHHYHVCSYNLTLERGFYNLTGTASYHDIKTIIELGEYLIKNWSPLK